MQWEQSNHDAMWTMMSAGKAEREIPCNSRSSIEHFQKEKFFDKDFTTQ